MASVLQQDVKLIETINYVYLGILTAVGYDYILTFPTEVEYIWNKNWTWVSTLFVLVRYAGLCYALGGPSSFVSMTKALIIRKQMLNSKGDMYLFTEWSFWIFMSSAELVMILRVWALYNRSRFVIGILLAFYAMEIISLFALYVIISFRAVSDSALQSVQLLQFSFCGWSESQGPLWLKDLPDASEIALGTLMCLFTSIKFINACRMRKPFRFNRYMDRLVRDGMTYFIVVLLFAVVSLLNNSGIQTTNDWLLLLGTTLQIVPPVTLVPRFILNLRELYGRDVQGRRGTNIDTAFGLGSGFEKGDAGSTMVFADPGKNGSEARGDEMEMETPEVGHTSNLA